MPTLDQTLEVVLTAKRRSFSRPRNYASWLLRTPAWRPTALALCCPVEASIRRTWPLGASSVNSSARPTWSHFHTQMRARGMFLLSRGLTQKQVAEEFEVHLNSVENWHQRWDKFGLVGLFEGQHTGRPPNVSDEERS
ncbi:MAG: hypothetical protein JWR65_2645 [Massilia sp.]|nr:hypothetical protein [Massilia sp.]